MDYNFKKIEKKWQKKWDQRKIFYAKENAKKKKFYVLEMYPYPSASFLHMGHVRNYSIGDVYARMKRMQGFNVLYPMGYDSFGLPAEMASKKEGINPAEYTKKAIKKIMEYQIALGNSYDWSRVISSHDPEYYKWNQYFFLKFLEKGLAYRKTAPVNWCNHCKSVLANEEAEGGKCWRCGNEVVVKSLPQWFFKITDYADRLLDDLKEIDWPERIKTMQENWIGKSQGVEIVFEIDGKKYPIFTTRADTLFGATFLVMSAQHPDLMQIVSDKQKKNVGNFLRKIRSSKEEDIEKLEKEGVFTGSYALHPLTKEKIPVWVGNFVLADYGSGIVMAVPAHDQRDFEFAQKYKLPVKIVVKPQAKEIEGVVMDKAYTDFGKLVNSREFNDLTSDEAKEHIVLALERKKLGKKTTNYRIRDWLISRQRYWGTPIPIIYCDDCGIVPVPEKDLPVLLPEKVKMKETGNPLDSMESFVNVKCPKCKSMARRETDTMGGFVDSSWYFLRFCDPKNRKKPFDPKKTGYWMPVDQYIGGAEHAVMHLLYARFFVKALKDLKIINFSEPFAKLFNQGIVYKDGAKMSKSKGNIVYQTDISDKYGIDTARLFLMFVSSPDKQMEWSDEGVEGSFKIINRLIRLKEKINAKSREGSKEMSEHKINKLIKEFTQSVESFDYPKAIVSFIGTLDFFSEGISKKDYSTLLKLIHPFCPHITEELWEKIGNKPFLSLEKWPLADEKKIKPELDKEEKLVEELVNDINNIANIVKGRGKNPVRAYIYSIPNETNTYLNNSSTISKKTGLGVKVYSVSDKSKHDPENKSKKVKPGKPGVYLE